MAKLSVEQALLRANSQLRRGEFDSARALYESVLAAFPNNVRAKQGLSTLDATESEIDAQQAPPKERIDALLATYNQSNFKEVVEQTEILLTDYPLSSVSWNILAVAQESLGQLAQAEEAFRKAIELNPAYAQAHYNLGNALKKQGKFDQAISAYRRALEINPTNANTYNNMGISMADLGQIDDALTAYRRALEIQPAYAEAYNNMGVSLKNKGKFDEALAAYRRALKIKPAYAEAHYNASVALKAKGETYDAFKYISKAIEIEPRSTKYRIAKISTILPIVWDSRKEASPLEKFDTELMALGAWASNVGKKNAFDDYIGTQQPFHLAYYPENMKERMETYSKIVSNQKTLNLYKERSAQHRGKINLGIVTAYAREHSVYGVITKGLLDNIDSDIFTIYLYNVEASANKNQQERLRPEVISKSFPGYQFKESAQSAIIEDEIDFLFYPEIGMDPTTIWLASKRLARFQALSWGHPITSGLATMDFFISGELIEQQDSQEHYTEQLVRLPGTGCCTSLKRIRGVECRFDIDKVGAGAPKFIIPQAPQKFHPSNDHLIVEIARGSPGAIFLIPSHERYPGSVDRIINRLESCAGDLGLGSLMRNRIFSIPWLPQSEFHYLLEKVDVFLDLPSFSGYTTALQALSCGLPVITLEGDFMRQRLAAGLLRQSGLPGTIANSRDEYVRTAIELGELSQDKVKYAVLREAIKDSVTNVIDSVNVVRAFEEFVQLTVLSES